MSHWTDRIFKDYKSDAKPAALNHEPEQDRDAFEIAALVSELSLPMPSARRRAARAIGFLGKRDGIPALIAALRDADESVRATAAEALRAFTLSAVEQDAVRIAAAAAPAPAH
jgi:HEAT repeat protein